VINKFRVIIRAATKLVD